MDETPSLDERIRELAEPFQGISVLAVFGSRARGTHRPDSDLDVAVLPTVMDSRARWLLRLDLGAALADLAPDGRVDVVLLDEAPDVLRQRVMEHGRILINRDPEAWKELRVRTMREYGDREWARREYEQAQYRRLQERRPSGRSPKALDSLRRLGRLSR
jgi:predicted nucleotidyltransferase